MVVDHIHLTIPLPPVVEPHSAVEGQRVQLTDHEVLEQQTLLGGIIQGSQPSLQYGVAHRAVHEIDLAAAALHRRFARRIIRKREHQEGALQVREVSIERRVGQTQVTADLHGGQESGDLARKNVEEALQPRRVLHAERLRNVLVDGTLDGVLPQNPLGTEQNVGEGRPLAPRLPDPAHSLRPPRVSFDNRTAARGRGSPWTSVQERQQSREATNQHERHAIRAEVLIHVPPGAQSAQCLTERVAPPRDAEPVLLAANQLQELTERVRHEELLLPAPHSAFHPATAQDRGRARRGGDLHRPVVVVERLEPEIPVIRVGDLVEHDVSRLFGRGPGASDHLAHELIQVRRPEERVVDPHPADASRFDALGQQPPDALVEDRGLAHPARAQDQLESTQPVRHESLPQDVRQVPFHGRRQRRRDLAEALPRILLREHPLEVFRFRPCNNQR